MMSILDLNADCLLVLFDFFSIYELIELEKVCKTFKSACNNVYTTRRFHKMRIELRDLKTDYFSNIFDRIGHTLRNFEFSGGYIMDENVKRTMINGVTESCPKLHSLTINYTQFSTTNFVQLQKCFTHLIYLDLSRCGIDENSLGLTLDSEKFPHIKTLKLAGNSCMNGSFFRKMKHVEVLDVSYCYELQFDEFLMFLKNCIQLVDLDVSASCRLVHGVENFLSVVYMHQPNVEKLLMENTGMTVEMEVLSKFSKLKVCCFEGRRFGT
ncbi:hypothetical protein HA402_009486 [Bradysia odoriphaga]|nr:hypothetical protein HA402_009486 [Bradysia odoriphaga]